MFPNTLRARELHAYKVSEKGIQVKNLEESVRMKNKALVVLFFTIFMDLMGFGLIIPILPIYAKELGATDAMVGLLGTSFSIMQFIFASFWGRLSDRFGRRPIILASISIMMLAYILFANATVLWLLFATRLLKGFGAANLSVAQAYISDIVPKDERTKAFGIIGAAFGLGFIFGPSIGGLSMNTMESVG